MRQTDIIDGIKDIIIGASIDASPENYEICHRYVARTDPAVCTAFEQALAQSSPISAEAFGIIREAAAPPRGQLDASKFLGKLDVELAKIFDATADAKGHSGEYSRSLDAGAADLLALGASPEAMKIIAALAAQTTSARERTEALERSLTDASDQLSGLRQELDRVKQESSSDALTSLPNRRAFDSGLIEAVSVAQADRQPLSLAFCDVDHFKKFNDTWGHRMGDQVLRFVGSQMANQFKEVGLPARFGGEEFVVLLPNHGSAEAYQAVERFCDTVRSRVLRIRSDGREVGSITLSVGVATLKRGEEPDAFVARADAAMYEAKKAGRNRVAFAS